MAITIVHAPGDPTANSYGSEAEMAAMALAHPAPDGWNGASGEERRAAMLAATMRLEQEDYLGTRASGTQALKHPRAGMVWDGITLASDAVAVLVKRAEFEEANAILADADAQVETGLEGYKSVDVGPISVVLREGQTPGHLTAATLRILAPLLAGGGSGGFRLLRS